MTCHQNRESSMFEQEFTSESLIEMGNSIVLLKKKFCFWQSHSILELVSASDNCKGNAGSRTIAPIQMMRIFFLQRLCDLIGRIKGFYAACEFKNGLIEPAKKIKVVLVERGRTGKWLAEQLGKSTCTVSKWCQNSIQPDVNTLAEIASLLNVDIRDLLVSTKE